MTNETANPLDPSYEGPEWIVNSMGELGVKIAGRCFFLYKGENIEYKNGLHDDGTPIMYRMVGKREFGEVCHPITCHTVENGILYDRTPFPYTKELVFTPGLSFGSPEDGAWRELPRRG